MNNAPLLLLGIKSALQQFGGWLKKLVELLTALGPFGLFAISLIDSAGLPLPGGPDAVMIILSAHSHAMVPVYAVAASLGSTIGCTIMYWVARRAGLVALNRIKPERRERVENLLGRYDMLAIMVTAILPPPFPFKPFVLSAGVFKLKMSRFIIAVFTGRLVRFTIEGMLAIAFGEEAMDRIKQHGLKVLLVVVIAVAVMFIVNKLRSRRIKTLTAAESQPPIK